MDEVRGYSGLHLTRDCPLHRRSETPLHVDEFSQSLPLRISVRYREDRWDQLRVCETETVGSHHRQYAPMNSRALIRPPLDL